MQSDSFTAKRARHRGVAALLAMLYLVLFSTLAVGFYAASNTAVIVSSNDQRGHFAFTAAESGLEFMRYQLANVSISPGTPLANTFTALYASLQSELNGTSNLAGGNIALSGNTISIPGNATQYINVDSGGTQAFRATITEWSGEIVVKITGRYATAAGLASGNAIYRSITLEFTRQSHPVQSFNYAVASKGQLLINKGGILSADPAKKLENASVMSEYSGHPSLTMNNGTVDGDLSIVSDGQALVSGGSVNGISNVAQIYANHVHVVDPPEFPTPDTSIFSSYAVNTYTSSKTTQQNIVIPPNTNPRLDGNQTVQGIMYVRSPNTVTIRGNVTLQGFIVFEQKAGDTQVLDIQGSISQTPLPSAPAFDAVRVTHGISILAPSASLKFGGASNSWLIGNVMVSTFEFKGSKTVQVDRGTMMTFKDSGTTTTFDSAGNVKFTGTGAGNLPSPGISYSTYFGPKAGSYTEILP